MKRRLSDHPGNERLEPREQTPDELPGLALHASDLRRIGVRGSVVGGAFASLYLLVMFLTESTPGAWDLALAALAILFWAVGIAPFSWLEFDAARRLEGRPTRRGLVAAFFASAALLCAVHLQFLFALRLQTESHAIASQRLLEEFLSDGWVVTGVTAAYLSLTLLGVTLSRLRAGSKGLRTLCLLLTPVHHAILRGGIWVGDALDRRLLERGDSEREESGSKGAEILR
ncbi:MAG: hypothetical protein JKY65_07855 [Planctomycetes bacterium]|nr:hypothetical protein [Planctomycetota bacterium]